jgi:hypothetical protein
MKYILIFSLLLTSLVGAEITPAMRSEFVARVKATAEKTEKDRFFALLCTDGLSEEMLKFARNSSEYNLSEIKKYKEAVTFVWSEPSAEMLEVPEANGFRYIPNLKIEEILTVSWHDDIRKSDVKSSFAIGVKDGKLWQIGTIKEPIQKK